MRSADVRPLSVYYRGALSSCNYDCGYCPFAKHKDARATVDRDAAALDRFIAWAASWGGELRILFTPWGEALVRKGYRDAVVRLSHLPNVMCVAVQTNLSMPLGWLGAAHRSSVALWCTYHPSQVTRAKFLARCGDLDALAIRYAVGMVGRPEEVAEIEQMRAVLRPDVYMWVNAVKRDRRTYDEEVYRRLASVDPHFWHNARHHPSRGQPCRAGEQSIAVDVDGNARRCHFVDTPLGNIHDDDFVSRLRPRPCPRDSCGCYIGYAQLVPLRLERVYGAGLLERIPSPARVRSF